MMYHMKNITSRSSFLCCFPYGISFLILVSGRVIEDIEADVKDLIWQTLKMIRYLVSK